MYYVASGGTVETDAVLGSGGEGNVHAVRGNHRFVAKLYHGANATTEQHRKLVSMVSSPPTDPCASLSPPHVSIAWPTDLLYSDRSHMRFAGFLMPTIAQATKIVDAYDVKARRAGMPGFTWKYLMCTARNLASSVQALHDRAYVVGDLNESNVLVTQRALIALIDTDSFQVSVGGQCLRCGVGKPEFTAPGSQMRDFATFDRTPHDDCFALAVVIFLLLMEGRHPFNGVPLSVPDLVNIGDRIKHNWFREIYASSQGRVGPPLKCPPLSMLPDAARLLFMRCFVDGERDPALRPSALEWTATLDATMSTLVNCSANSFHVFGPHLPACPWCERMKRHQIADPFPARPPKRVRPVRRQASVAATSAGRRRQRVTSLGAAYVGQQRQAAAATLPQIYPALAGAAAVPPGQPIPSAGATIRPGRPVPTGSSVPPGTPIAPAASLAATAGTPAGSAVPAGAPVPAGLAAGPAQSIARGLPVPAGRAAYAPPVTPATYLRGVALPVPAYTPPAPG